ncbi:MAG: hypothetical protein A3K03_08650 [Bdellovibrionales bacterium RIFOXYD1_FULL_44_7]|nr:MAG: hypothetical protein A3K03_08650 [Bdellovibrionales bacterium RIFOXYD1_FULL_44_7]
MSKDLLIRLRVIIGRIVLVVIAALLITAILSFSTIGFVSVFVSFEPEKAALLRKIVPISYFSIVMAIAVYTQLIRKR